MTNNPQAIPSNTPTTGYLRLPQVLALIPIGRSSWYRGISEGRYPKGTKLSARVTAWRTEEIYALLDQLAQEEGQ